MRVAMSIYTKGVDCRVHRTREDNIGIAQAVPMIVFAVEMLASLCLTRVERRFVGIRSFSNI